jgi:hypothetical protein
MWETCLYIRPDPKVPENAPPVGGQRFLDLSEGKEGVAFRKTKFELLEDGWVLQGSL